MRTRQETVAVIHRDGVPAQFLREGRRYLIRSVLDSWVQTSPWWTGVVSRSLVAGEQPGGGEPAGSVGMLDTEHRFWRVEAAPGCSGLAGVYDLCTVTATGRWALVRVLD